MSGCNGSSPDCMGICDGPHLLDCAGVCYNPNDGSPPNLADCSGECNGTHLLDCVGNCYNPCDECAPVTFDCMGICGGDHIIDTLGNCILRFSCTYEGAPVTITDLNGFPIQQNPGQMIDASTFST